MKDIILTRDIVGREPDQRILDFIEEFNKAAGDSVAMFSNGYCYHFAAMLASVFEGQIMWPLGVSHMVFMSEDLVPYDRYGQNDSECDAFISLHLMESDSLYGFKHKDNRPHNFMADLVTLARIDQKSPGLTHKVIPMITANLPGFETLTPEEALQRVCVYTLDMFLKDVSTLIQVMEKYPETYQQWFTTNFPNGASSKKEVLNKLKED